MWNLEVSLEDSVFSFQVPVEPASVRAAAQERERAEGQGAGLLPQGELQGDVQVIDRLGYTSTIAEVLFPRATELPSRQS